MSPYRRRGCRPLAFAFPAGRGSLSWDDIRELELTENVQRLDLTTFEQNRQMVEAADEEIERITRQSAEKKKGRGRAATYAH